MTTGPRIDLSQFSRGQLKQLIEDAKDEMASREAEDHAAFEAKCRALAVEFGFDETVVRLAGNGRRAARKPRKNGDPNE